MGLKDIFGKKNVKTTVETTVKTTVEVEEVNTEGTKDEKSLNKVAPKDIGVLDMVIAFDTTGSMAAYIGAVRKEVSELVPRLFKDNENLRLGIVAFGDYCDMKSASEFGDAYQCLMLTANENDIIKFVRETKDTSGGDGDEFYELVIKKIVEETPWRDNATKAILLISDANPHPLGYTYEDYVVGNQIDWRKEAEKAVQKKIKIDTVTITDEPWYKELSKMTNGISVPFESGYKTARLVEAATMSRGSMASRMKFDRMAESCADEEMAAVYRSYRKERDDVYINMNTLQDRIRGSLIGGAIGDALGYPVEFMSRKNILHKYGDRGVHKYVEFDRNGKAVVSDDTQMTLFTANGLLFGVTRFCTHGILGAGLKDYVAYAYQDWLQTQIGVKDYNAYHYCWIRDIVELNVRRAPGNTCMSALMSMKHHQQVDNDSKGCGGVMRVAPVGMMAAADEQVVVKDWYGKEVPRREWQTNEIVRLGGDCAEITHKHPLGYLSAAFMADLIYYILMHDETITFSVFEGFLGAVYADVKREYTTEREQQALDELWILIEKAINQSGDITVSDEYAIPCLGEGWTGDEALAIAIYCAMKHLDNFEDALAAAVNHDGDSDSTGAICGNLMGAIIGYNAIPEHFKQKLELRNLLLDMADDIVRGCHISEYHAPETPDEQQWERRYVKIEPVSPKHFKGVFSFLNAEYHIMPQAQKTATARSN